MQKKYAFAALSLLTASLISGCATESSRAIQAPPGSRASQPVYQGRAQPDCGGSV
ncbi:Uncharacterised protein [Pantoea agglomerans]|uniref:Lipoprotein n=1 Tax=Enterobacter agglomerans TaxID=549 RepID=A0A379AJQ6_ENTAG|nr:Uncharacterised protein [Pantoea agglomerans]